MDFSLLKKHLDEIECGGVYVIKGTQHFLVNRAVKMFMGLTNEIDVSVFTQVSFQAIAEAFDTMPFMSARKVLIVNEYKFDSGSLKALSKLSQQQNENILVFCYQPAAKIDAELLKIKTITAVECNALSPPQLKRWVMRQAESLGGSIAGAAAELLVEFCLGDMCKIDGEITKLCAYKNNEAINTDDVRELVVPDSSYSVFKLSDAIVARDRSQVFKVYNYLISIEQPSALLWRLYTHFRRLFLFSASPDDPEIFDHIEAKGYAASVVAKQSKLFKVAQLDRMRTLLAQLDSDVKNGRIPAQTALERFIFEVLN